MDRHELAWAAGFFDGEGWASAVAQKSRRTRQPHAQINQSDDNGVPVALERFRNALGVGRIGGPEHKPDRIDRYWWIASSTSDVADVWRLLDPWLGAVKRAAFAVALGEQRSAQQWQPSHTEMLSWAGGLYDGEGSASLTSHRTHLGHYSPEVAVAQSGAGVPEVLERFREIVGRGHIDGPYTQEGATLPVYRWKTGAITDVEQTIYLLSPWIGPVKRDQARRVSQVLVEQGRLPRGNVAWGNRKTHCIRGHEYAMARIRPFVPRSGGTQPRENQHCLVCLRDYAREQRQRNKTIGGYDDRRSISDRAQIYLLK
jgi:hypothetical protein